MGKFKEMLILVSVEEELKEQFKLPQTNEAKHQDYIRRCNEMIFNSLFPQQ